MVRTTRSSKAAVSKAILENLEVSEPDPLPVNKLPPSTSNPPHVFILPKAATAEACVVTLNHPRYNRPARYLACPETGLYEFSQITASKSDPRSWLLEPTERNGSVTICKTPEMFIATAIDPLFLLLPVLFGQGDGSQSKRMFLSLDHHIDNLSQGLAHMDKVLASPKTRSAFEKSIRPICDTVDAGSEVMLRLNESKLLECLLERAQRLCEPSLPLSMEDKFVTSVLAAPVFCANAAPNATEAVCANNDNSLESTGKNVGVPDHAVLLQRRRVAFRFICSRYIPVQLEKKLNELLPSASIDFTPLDNYIGQLSALKQEALTARPMIDYTSKRGFDEDDSESTERMHKRLKKEEEEKRKKASMSRGVKELMKVDTKGMKKMSDFFKKV